MMTLDLKKYLLQIPEDNWRIGNGSKYALSGNYFFKRLTAKAPAKVHDFFIKGRSTNRPTLYRPKFEDYHCLTDDECQFLNYKGENAKYNHVYVFGKVDFAKLEEQFKTKNIKEYITALDQLHYFFAEIDRAGITYHDVMWENILWNKTSNELCVIDLDSMVESTEAYESLSNLGSPLFHTSFLKFREKYAATQYKLNDIKYLNLCVFHNIFFAFVLGLSLNNNKFSQMKEKIDVNLLVESYIKGNYINKTNSGKTIDINSKETLKKATEIVSSYITGRYSGNPFTDMASLANELAHKIQAKPVHSQPAPPKPENLGKIPFIGPIRYTFGALFLFMSLCGFILDGFIAGLLFLLAAFITIPTTGTLIQKKVNISMPGTLQFFIIFFLVVIALSAIPTTPTANNTPAPTSDPVATPTPTPDPVATPTPIDNPKGKLDIYTNPVGATVTIDGNPKGITPIEGLSVEAGTHSVIMYLSGYYPQKEKVEVTNSGTKQLFYTLIPETKQSSTPISTQEEIPTTEVTSTPEPASASAKIENTWIEHNVLENGSNGMRTHVKFDTFNLKGKKCSVNQYFYFDTGEPLKNYNNYYGTFNGNVASGEDYTPLYEDDTCYDLSIFIPYSEFHMAQGTYNLKFQVVITDEDDVLVTSDWIPFQYTQ